MILFIILKLTKVIGISWWWIVAAIFATAFPLGLTISFILLKTLGGFTTDVSWWWIILPIVIDLGELKGEHKLIS